MNVKFQIMGCVCAAAFSSSVYAQENAPLFPKKTVTLYIGNTAGGTYDLYGRLTAKYLGRFLPGNPAIVPENMPGAGTIRAANYIYNVASRDGTAMGIVAETIAVEQAIGNPAVQYDARKYTWIGRIVSSAGVHIMWHTSKVRTLEDARQHESLLAGTGAGNVAETVPTLMNALLGTKFKIIRGYPSATEALLAMERGEVEGTAVNWVGFRSSRPDWIKDRKVTVLFQYLPERGRDIPDAPALGEMGNTPEAKQLFRLYGSMATIGRSILASPDIPPATAAALRSGFNQMVKDPDFNSEVKRLGTDLDVATGEQLQLAVQSTLDIPASVIENAKAIFAR